VEIQYRHLCAKTDLHVLYDLLWFIYSYPLMWHYRMCRHYALCCPVFLSWCYLHYTMCSLDIHISFIWSLIWEIFYAMHLALHFLHIYYLDFHLKKKMLPSNFEKILWSHKFLKYPLVEIIFYKNQDGICFLIDLGLWILTLQPFHSYTLAYCRPIHLISIEFQTLTTIQALYQENFFFPFNCYNLAILEVTLTKMFSIN
jgi:hypothetical protein